MNKEQLKFVSLLMIVLLYVFSYVSMNIYTEMSMSYFYSECYLKPEKDFEFEQTEENKVTVKPNKKVELKNLNYKYINNNKRQGSPRCLHPSKFIQRRGTIPIH